ncbi:MAG: hypothetical protein KIT14_10300 [bacterium]|nr:hypothetical protein [bacterium]
MLRPGVMRLRVVLGVMVLGSMVAGIAVAQETPPQTPPSTPSGWAVLGRDAVTLGPRNRITGPAGVTGGELRLRRRARVSAAAAAQSIRLAGGARVGALYCILVVGGSGSCSPPPDPLVDKALLPVVQATPGGQDIKVPRRARRLEVDPGRYRDVEVGAGSELRLAAGTFDFRSVTLGAGASLLCLGPCEIDVRRGFQLGARGHLEAAPGAVAPITLRVQGDNKGIVRLGARSRVTADVYAPTTEVRFGARSRLSGRVVGEVVNTAGRVQITHPDAATP